MSAQNGSAMPPALPAVNTLIKPDDILKISSFPDELRSKYVEGVSKLWGSIRNLPPEHEGHQAAHRKLVDITNQIRNHLRSKNLSQTGTGGAAPTSQATTTTMAQADRGPAAQLVLPNGQLQISQKVAQVAVGLQLMVPPPYAAQGQEMTQKWIKEAKQKYAQQLQRYETYQAQLSEIAQLVENRKKEGKMFTEQEKLELTTRKNAAEGVRNQAREYLVKFKQQQDALKAALAGNNLSAPQLDGTTISNNPTAMTENGEGNTMTQGSLSQQQSEHQGQAHTVSSALDAARQHAGSTERTATSPTNPQYNQPLANENSGMQGQYIKKELPGPQPPLNIATDAGPSHSHHDSPQAGQPPGSSTQGPYPLTHQAAMASAAHKYAQQNSHQATPQSTTHAHPTMSNRPDPSNNNNVKFPIPKELKVGPPQPVTMGPARPTLTGGPSNGAMGQLGQPAISRHPGYVLEGEGDRVLSKKRLQQLAREVTGASEGDDAEVMTPDVEEVRRLAPNIVAFSILSPQAPHLCSLNKLTTQTDTPPSRGRFHRSGGQQCLQARQVT